MAKPFGAIVITTADFIAVVVVIWPTDSTKHLFRKYVLMPLTAFDLLPFALRPFVVYTSIKFIVSNHSQIVTLTGHVHSRLTPLWPLPFGGCLHKTLLLRFSTFAFYMPGINNDSYDDDDGDGRDIRSEQQRMHNTIDVSLFIFVFVRWFQFYFDSVAAHGIVSVSCAFGAFDAAECSICIFLMNWIASQSPVIVRPNVSIGHSFSKIAFSTKRFHGRPDPFNRNCIHFPIHCVSLSVRMCVSDMRYCDWIYRVRVAVASFCICSESSSSLFCCWCCLMVTNEHLSSKWFVAVQRIFANVCNNRENREKNSNETNIGEKNEWTMSDGLNIFSVASTATTSANVTIFIRPFSISNPDSFMW